MSLEPSVATPGGISPPSYQPSWEPPSLFRSETADAASEDGSPQVWQRALPESPRGGYWTVSSSGLHSAAAVSLSSRLEPAASIPPKYWLSAKACAGILRRAAKRGKALPPMLAAALMARALEAVVASNQPYTPRTPDDDEWEDEELVARLASTTTAEPKS